MEIHQLRYFVAVAQEASFSRAAAKLRVAQPSLSQQIQKLETELGKRVFDRLTRRVLLTEAGHDLLPFAHRILNELNSAERLVKERGSVLKGTVRVGILPTIAPFIARALVRSAGEALPQVALTLVEDVTAHLAQQVDAGELDLAIMSTCRAAPGIHVEMWLEEELVAALPERHELASLENVRWRGLQNEFVLLLHESHCLSRQIQKWCNRHKMRGQEVGALQLPTLLEMVAAGRGISLVPKMAAQQRVEGIVFRRFRDDVPTREINLLRNAYLYQSKMALAIAEIGRDVVLATGGQVPSPPNA